MTLNFGINTRLGRERQRPVSPSLSIISRVKQDKGSMFIFSFLAPQRKSLWRNVFRSVVPTAETNVVHPIIRFPKVLVVLKDSPRAGFSCQCTKPHLCSLWFFIVQLEKYSDENLRFFSKDVQLSEIFTDHGSQHLCTLILLKESLIIAFQAPGQAT